MTTVAERMRPVVTEFLPSEITVRISFWDGSSLGEGATTVAVRNPTALRRMLWSPGELGFSRAYVAGDIDIDGNVFDVLSLRDVMTARTQHLEMRLGTRGRVRLAGVARSVGALGLPIAPPPEEARLRGPLHSKERDAAAVAHHYDVGNDFYRLVLGKTMTYSCAYFPREDMSLDEAQEAKYELICRKLGLESGMRLLDVGCGWGGMALHAAKHHGASVVGITLSRAQADLAAKRVAEAGLTDKIEIRYQDYRDVSDGPFDAISSIGMFEHVGVHQLTAYFETLLGLLAPGRRLLNHAISRPSGKPGFKKKSFVARYVFPDGELIEVGAVVTAMQSLGFEVRDVESLREHYATTLRAWVGNLEANWDRAVELAGLPRAKVWRLYMGGSAMGFEAARINVHQVLAVKPHPDGASGMPADRSTFASA